MNFAYYSLSAIDFFTYYLNLLCKFLSRSSFFCYILLIICLYISIILLSELSIPSLSRFRYSNWSLSNLFWVSSYLHLLDYSSIRFICVAYLNSTFSDNLLGVKVRSQNAAFPYFSGVMLYTLSRFSFFFLLERNFYIIIKTY